MDIIPEKAEDAKTIDINSRENEAKASAPIGSKDKAEDFKDLSTAPQTKRSPLNIKHIPKGGTSRQKDIILTANQDTLFTMMVTCQRNQILLQKKIESMAVFFEGLMTNQAAIEKKILWIMGSLGAEVKDETGIEKKSSIIGANQPIIQK